MKGSETSKINKEIIEKVKELGVSVEEVANNKHLKYRLVYNGKEASMVLAVSSGSGKYKLKKVEQIAKTLEEEFGFDRKDTKQKLRLMIGTERELTAKQQAALEWWRSELERSADDRLSDAESVKRSLRNARRRELYRMRKVDAGSR